MKNSKITKIVYTIVVFLTTVFVFGQDEPAGFGDDVVDNAPVSPIDNYLFVGIVIAVLFAIYSIQRNYFRGVVSIKKEQN